MLKKLWLRDYNLPLMHERIKRQLTRGENPDDCVVNIKEVKRYIKEVFEVMDIIINYKPDEYRLKRYKEEKKRHLSTFENKSNIIADKQNPQKDDKIQFIKNDVVSLMELAKKIK